MMKVEIDKKNNIVIGQANRGIELNQVEHLRLIKYLINNFK